MLNIKSEYGKIIIENEVIEQLIMLKIRKVKGIIEKEKNKIRKINNFSNLEMIKEEEKQNNKDKNIEIKIETKEQNILIELFLTILYGIRIPDLAWEIQSKIKEEIVHKLAIDDLEINIHIQGIYFPNNHFRKKDLILSDLSIQVI